MFFKKMREQVKVIIIIVCVAFVGGMLYVGGTSLFGGGSQQVAQAAIAVVNGQGISYSDFQQAFISRLQQTEMQQGRIEGRMFESLRYQTLDSIIGQLLIEQEIAERKIEVPKNEVDARLQEIKDQFPDKESYESQLKMVGISEQQLKTYLEDDLKVEKLRDQVAGPITVPEEEIVQEYEEVKVRHILVRNAGNSDEDWAAAKEKAEEIRAQLTVDNFADIAKEHSEDTGSGQEGGDIGFIKRGDTVPQFEEAAFSLEVGTISEPVRSDYGYHILLVTEKKLAEGEEFAEARTGIEEQLRTEKAQAALAEWYQELRENADVVVKDYQMLAHENVTKEKYDDAIHYYNLAIEENPNDGYLHSSLGDTYRKQERFDEALAEYQKATELISNDPDLFRVLGDLYGQVENQDEAVVAYLKASELAPNDIFLQLDLYNKLNGMERIDEAKQVEDRIAEYQKRQEELRELQNQAEKSAEEADEVSEEDSTPAETE